MIDSLFTLYCQKCEASDRPSRPSRPSRLWVRAEIESSSPHGPETQHYLECMNCGFRFKSRMEDHMEAVGEDEWRRFVDETVSDSPDSSAPAS